MHHGALLPQSNRPIPRAVPQRSPMTRPGSARTRSAAGSSTRSDPEPETETPAAIETPPIETQESFAASQLVDGGDATLAMDRNQLESILASTPSVETSQTPFNAVNIPEEEPANDNRQTSDSFSALSALSGAPTGESMSRDGFVSSLAGGAAGKLVRGSTVTRLTRTKNTSTLPRARRRGSSWRPRVFDRQRKRKRA